MLSLDVRTLSFLAMITSLLLAAGLLIVNRVITRNPALRLWAMGATAIGSGFVLLALRGLIPELFSIVMANTLLAIGSVWHYLGNRAFQGRKDEFPWYWWLAAGTAVLFFNFTYLMPNLAARIVVISAVLAVLRFASAKVLLSPGTGQDKLVRWCVAGAYLITAVFLGTRAVVSLFLGPTDQNFMAASGAIQTFAFVLEISLNLILGIGLPLLVLGRTQRQILESEARFRHFFQKNSSVMLLIEPASGLILEANKAADGYYGYATGQLAGMPISKINILPEESIAAERKLALHEERNYFNFPHRLASGEVREVEVHSSPIETDGRVLLFSIIHDITSRKQTEAELMRSNSELEQFSYSISHDMRQPLRMISSYLQLLQSGLGDTLDAEKREYFNFAIDGAQRLDAMLRGLLDYSRIGRKDEPPAWIDSRAALDDALLFLRPAISEVQAEVRIEGEWPRLLTSPDEMLRLLQNLVGNALKFRVEGRTPTVCITSTVGDGQWRVSVVDNGIGILPDQISRLFLVFQRLQSRTAYEGTGIGLALCRKIVEHHGGTIRADSAGPDLGSSFTFSLPTGPAEAAPEGNHHE
jgi:PAS domain S-box-containing protein